MTEQFGPIPVRAFGDTRLSAADFRVMGAIAYYDRLGRNGAGCYVDRDKLAAGAAVLYEHLSRHTKRLREFGYLEIYRSGADRRRRIYALIYNENRVVVANSGDNSTGGEAREDTVAALDEKVTTSGDNPAEKVTNAESQVVEPPAKSNPKRLSEAYLKNPAKPRALDGEKRPRAAKSTNQARQGDDRGAGSSRAQINLLLPMRGGEQQPGSQPKEPDFTAWANYLAAQPGGTKFGALKRLAEEIDRIAAEKGVGHEQARALLDKGLKKYRWAAG